MPFPPPIGDDQVVVIPLEHNTVVSKFPAPGSSSPIPPLLPASHDIEINTILWSIDFEGELIFCSIPNMPILWQSLRHIPLTGELSYQCNQLHQRDGACQIMLQHRRTTD